MREIQFRAKPCYDGVKRPAWVYGTFRYIAQRVVDPTTTLQRVPGGAAGQGMYHGLYLTETEVLCDTVCQYTGLLDKEFERIYEGDIVRWDKDGKLYVVEFRSGMFYASVEPCNEHVYGGFPLWCLCVEELHCTVVGNRFDNPELLKG